MSQTLNGKSIVFLTTAWGAKFGGINTFNMDIAIALAKLLNSGYHVFCIALDALDDEVKVSLHHGVQVFSLKSSDSIFDERCAYEVSAKFFKKYPDVYVEWWIGHDIISGQAACKLPEISGQGKSAVIKHMSYIDYVGFRDNSGSDANEKHLQQKDIFMNSDRCFAVGPFLRDALQGMGVAGSVTMLTPGLDNYVSSAHPRKNNFSAITFGRLETRNDKIKQPTLAVDAFGTAIKEARTKNLIPHLKKHPSIFLYGLSETDKEKEEQEFKLILEEAAGEYINLIGVPYTIDRKELFDRLHQSHVALVLSWHEGFGLTGWEAISAEVPLILSTNSGLYELIDEVLDGAGTGCIYPVDIKAKEKKTEDSVGSGERYYQEESRDDVKTSILVVAQDVNKAQRNARRLKELLLKHGFTWESSAKTFAHALDLSYDNELSCSSEVEEVITEKRANEAQFTDIFRGNVFGKCDLSGDFKCELLPNIRSLICYNQGEFAQYSIIASMMYNSLMTKKEELTPDQYESNVNRLKEYLNRNIRIISLKNFKYLKKYFEGRNKEGPRFCTKVNISENGELNVFQFVRDSKVKYFSKYPLSANTAFEFIYKNGTYFLCNDIPKSIANGTYSNFRIGEQAVIEYLKKREGDVGDQLDYDRDWVNCWVDKDSGDGEHIDSRVFYKSTLVFPMTLLNNDLDSTFRDLLGIDEDAGRSIFGYLCMDHVEKNYFFEQDIDIGYIFADILSIYYLTRDIYIQRLTN